MGLIDRLKGFFYTTPQQQGMSFFEYQGQTVWTAMDNPETIAEWILKCPPLAYILNRKAMAFINGTTEVLNAKTGNYVRGAYKQWEDLLANPNPIQTDRQFRVELYTYIQAYGYCPVLIDQPAGFTDYSRISEMWVLPPNFCDITFYQNKYIGVRGWQDMIQSFYFNYGGERKEIDKSKVFFFTDISTNLDCLQFPDSKLIPLKYPINNLIKSYEARGVIAERRGAVGLLSNDDPENIASLPMTEQDIKATQDAYRRYGLSKDQWHLFITNKKLRYQQMAMPVRDMMLLEMEEADVRTICNALGYPYHLLSNTEGTTFSNMEVADQSLYQNSIIPDALNFTEQLNKAIHAKDNGIRVNYDYSWLPAMQADEKVRAEVRKRASEGLLLEYQNNLITWNEYREGVGADKVEGMDKYYYELKKEQDNGTPQTTDGAAGAA